MSDTHTKICAPLLLDGHLYTLDDFERLAREQVVFVRRTWNELTISGAIRVDPTDVTNPQS